MILELKIPDDILLDSKAVIELTFFLQANINRLVIGNLRYGVPEARKKYMSRMRRELKVYVKDGNFEQLINIANYCFLESYKPENKKFHFNSLVESVTRDIFEYKDNEDANKEFDNKLETLIKEKI